MALAKEMNVGSSKAEVIKVPAVCLFIMKVGEYLGQYYHMGSKTTLTGENVTIWNVHWIDFGAGPHQTGKMVSTLVRSGSVICMASRHQFVRCIVAGM